MKLAHTNNQIAAHSQTSARRAAPSAPSLTPPIQLITALRDNPLALGLLCLIQRLFLIHQRPIPLSAADVAACDPSASQPAARRALDRLIRAGGLIVTGRRGTKHVCVPGWGIVAGQPRPWDAGRKMFNRPTHLPTVQLDVRIFDYFLGRLVLHERLPALAERYVSAPLLSLRDIGALLLVQAGLAAPADAVERLARCGLLRDGRPCGLPADADDVLRWVSQGLLGDGAPTLSEKGLRRLGLLPQPANPSPAPSGQPLVYLELDHYLQVARFDGCCAGDLAGLNCQKLPTEIEVLPALEEGKSMPPLEPDDFTWNLKQKKHESTLPSGKVGWQHKFFDRRRKPLEPIPETPTAALLRELGIRPSSIRELCHIDVEHARGIIAYGRGRSDVRSLAGWIVQALRDHRDQGWVPPAPADPYAGLFDPEKYARDGHRLFARPEPAAAEPEASSAAEPALRHQAAPEELMGWMAATLKRMFRREHYGLLDRLRLIDAGDAPVFSCGVAEDLAQLADGLDYYVANLCRDFGWPEPPRFVLAEAAPAGEIG